LKKGSEILKNIIRLLIFVSIAFSLVSCKKEDTNKTTKEISEKVDVMMNIENEYSKTKGAS